MARGSLFLFALLVAGALAACTGGGGTPAPPTPVPTASLPPSTTLWVTAGSTAPPASFHSEVDVFPVGATGNTGPTRQIGVSTTFGTFPESVAVDSLGNAYIGVSAHGFQITSPSSCGTGCAGTSFVMTGASSVFGIALDSARCVYVSAGTAIEVYNNGVKQATIPNASTNPVAGLAVDRSDNVYAIDSNSYTAGSNNVQPSIAIFHGGVCGTQSFQSAIGGSNTQLVSPAQIVLDAAGFIYVSDAFAKSVFVYAPGATGNVAPVRTIAGSNTGFQKPWGIAVDSLGVLHVGDQAANAVFNFPAGATGNVAPTNTLTGPTAGGGFNGPLGITTQ